MYPSGALFGSRTTFTHKIRRPYRALHPFKPAMFNPTRISDESPTALLRPCLRLRARTLVRRPLSLGRDSQHMDPDTHHSPGLRFPALMADSQTLDIRDLT